MTKTNKTRSALFTSIISLLLCVSMLVGTTFAWFTDSVESGRNLITAGNLDVELYWSADCNSWTKVKADTNIFDDGYWEPGHTEVVYLKVVNEGTLALKYQLGVNIVSEQPGTNVAGKVFNLSDYIQFGVADRATAYTGRAEAVAAVAGSSKKISSGFSKSSELYPANSTEGASEECVALVVYMPETVGNEANYMTGTTPPQISLGLNVFATQETYENDSFGADYDENTMWAGDTDTSWYNDTDTEFTLDTPQKLAGLAELVNNGNSFAGKTIKLGADIDLNGDEGVLWTPIGIADNNFNGRFIGTGHTISNLYAVGTTGVGLIGIAGNAAHIEGVTVIGADVVGTHYVGAVLGYGYLAKDCLINCYVEGATIICNPVQKADGSYDDGNQAGVIAGMALNGNITGNTAKNSTVYAYRDMGGIVGCASAENRDVKVEGNTIEGVKLIQVGVMGTYEKDANIGDIVGRIAEHTGKVTIGTNTGTAEIDKSKAITINTLAELVAFAEMVNAGKTYKGETILLGADIDLGNREWTPIGEGSNAFQGTFDGQGHVISNLKITGNNNKVGLFGNTNSGEIKNLTIENALVSGRSNVGVVAGNPYTSRYTNITVKGHVEVNGKFYVGGVGGKNAYTNWTNITVDVDETSYVKADSVEDGVAYRTYVGGVVGFNGEGGHTFKNITSNIDVFGTTIDVGGAFGIAHYGNNFENVTVTGNVTITDAAEAGDAEEIGGIAGVWMNSGSNVTFTNCKFTGKLTSNISEGVDLSDNTITGKGYYAEDSNFLIIDGVNQYDQAVVANATDLADALSAGKDVILTQNVTLSETVEIPAGAEVTLNLNGKTVSGSNSKDAGALLVNQGTLVIDGGKMTNTAVNGGAIIDNKGTLTLEDVEIVGAPIGTTDYPSYAIYTSGKLTVEEGTSVTSDRGAISLSDGADVTINGGSIAVTDALGTRVLTSHVIYAYGYNSKLTIKDGTFAQNYQAAGNTGASVICPAGATINIYGGTFTYAGTVGQSAVFQNYMGYGAPVNVYGGTFNDKSVEKNVADGYEVNEENGIWTVSATKVSSSSDLSSAISEGKAVELTEDITYSTAINKDATINLAGNTFEATNTIKLSNNADLTMSGGDYVVNSTYGHIDVRPNSAEGSVLTFENVDFSFNKLGPTYGPSTNRLGSVVEVCAEVADAKTVVVFKNCTFNNAQVVIEGMSGKTGIADVTFENCTFNALTSSAPIYVQNYVSGKLTVTGCTFNLECTSSSASAISVSPSTSTTMEVIAKNNTINAVAATPTDSSVTGVDVVKVNGTPKDIKFIFAYANTTVTETGTVKTGIAAQ